MDRRITVLFSGIILMFCVCIFRVYYVEASDYLTMASTTQGRYSLDIANARGGIYDRAFSPLVNARYKHVAAILPTPQAASELLRVLPEEQHAAILEQLSGGLPFAMDVPTNNIYATGIDVFSVPTHYTEDALAVHLIGYLGDEGKTGVAGIERAFDRELSAAGGRFSARYHMDASGRTMQGGGVEITRENEDSAGGVVLTLDEDIQRVTETALAAGCDSGAAVVLDISTGDILAMASLPDFDQNDIAASLTRTDAPFINRATSGYNIGSVFKLVVAAAALETGYTPSRYYFCEGSIDIGGQVFHCNNHAIHGELDMQRALSVSCNTYFISLAQEMEPVYLLAFCRNLGLGTSLELAPGLFTQAGNLPDTTELQNPAALANFSFGQGSSLASPLQIAQVIATIAGGGISVTPRLVLGLTEDGTSISQPYPIYAGSELLSQDTSEAMQSLMVGVIVEGSGRTAQPLLGSAGGKTSSAQTGQTITGEDGEEKELVHAWFAGFYPADQPRYSVVVFVEGGESGEYVAGPIFKQILDGIGILNARQS